MPKGTGEPALEDELEDEVDDLLDALAAAPEPGSRPVADEFLGHPLPLPFASPRWDRRSLFQESTCHYHPAIAGDFANGATVTKLAAIGEAQKLANTTQWGTTYAYEMRSLVPTASYLSDTKVAAIKVAKQAAHSMRTGDDLPEDFVADLVDMATQVTSVLAHVIERIDVLRAASHQSDIDVEVLSRLYDAEDRFCTEHSSLAVAVELQ